MNEVKLLEVGNSYFIEEDESFDIKAGRYLLKEIWFRNDTIEYVFMLVPRDGKYMPGDEIVLAFDYYHKLNYWKDDER